MQEKKVRHDVNVYVNGIKKTKAQYVIKRREADIDKSRWVGAIEARLLLYQTRRVVANLYANCASALSVSCRPGVVRSKTGGHLRLRE